MGLPAHVRCVDAKDDLNRLVAEGKIRTLRQVMDAAELAEVHRFEKGRLMTEDVRKLTFGKPRVRPFALYDPPKLPDGNEPPYTGYDRPRR